ncbi:ROK family protein [Patescibacteria group bacterium]|nr:ROK family protein [Patescibacteria group bacterium]
MAKNKHILGIDVGGTNTKFGLVTGRGKLVKSKQIATPKTKPKIIELLCEQIELHQKEIDKIGLGLPGPLDLKNGRILKTPNLPLADTPIVKILKQKFKLPIKIENDANCFTLAEAVIGAGKNYPTVAGLTLGTGVGGGIVIDKKIFHGRGSAGELGHLFIDFKRAADLEDLIGAKSLNLSAENYQILEKLEQQKDERALKFWKELGLTIGFGCLNIIHALDPDIIVLGGKQSLAFSLFQPEMLKTINKHCLTKPPKIVKSKLIDKAGVIGAALLFK